MFLRVALKELAEAAVSLAQYLAEEARARYQPTVRRFDAGA